jgi:histidyl-tRNA synthetase
MWYLRLTHTRLADSILELCGVPSKESVRRLCLRILTHSTAPAPHRLAGFLVARRQRSSTGRQKDISEIEELDRRLSDAVSNHGLPSSAADKLRIFVTKGCLPLPVDILDAIETLHVAVSHLRQCENRTKEDPRQLKRFEDVSRSLKSLESLVQLMYSVDIGPLLGGVAKNTKDRMNRPLYISLDLGLRQRRKHYHGQVFFQCIAIPDNYFDQYSADDGQIETNDTIISHSGRGSKIAEGGRYDELVSDSWEPLVCLCAVDD